MHRRGERDRGQLAETNRFSFLSVGFPWGNEEGDEQFELKRRRFIRNGYFQIAPLTSDI
jgi:hypothetical protein